MDIVEKVCNRAIVITKGNLVANLNIDNYKKANNGQSVEQYLWGKLNDENN